MSVALPNSNITLEGSGLDKNGNKIVRLSLPYIKNVFSIQTTGNLNRTGSILRGLKTARDMQKVKDADLLIIEKEVIKHIKSFGSATQKAKLKIYN